MIPHSPGVPALPVRSARRTSHFLPPIDTKAAFEQRPLSITSPHDYYLSSEEDVSSSADDFSDFDFNSEDDQVIEKARASAITARAVSVIFSGKPVVVDLSGRSRSAGSDEAMGIRRAGTEPCLNRPVSTMSTNVFASSVSSGRLPLDSERSRPAFLKLDPFAAKSEDIERPKTPLTPTAMVKRGFSLMKKKKSRPQLRASGLYREDNASVQTLPTSSEDRSPHDSPVSEPQSPYYQLQSSRTKHLQKPSRTVDMASMTPDNAPSNMSRLRAGLNLGARRSMRA